MSKEKQQKHDKIDEADGILKNETEIKTDAADAANATEDSANEDNKQPDELKAELENIKSQLEEKNRQCADYLDRLQRTAAEFDNFKKRSIKEKEAAYTDAACDVVKAFLPVLDNVERALKAIPEDEAAKSLKDGVEMVFKQFKETFKNLGVEEIPSVDCQFDPMLHNAVMHVEDDSFGHNTVVEEFQKGYMYKDKVIRYSMVKVAN